MKIALPLDENKKDVCVSFGRTPFFMVYDNETHEKVIVENDGAQEVSGAGLKAAQVLLDNDIDVLITIRCGENAAKIFDTAQMKIYKAFNGSIDENIKAFESNELDVLTSFHAGFHGGK